MHCFVLSPLLSIFALVLMELIHLLDCNTIPLDFQIYICHTLSFLNSKHMQLLAHMRPLLKCLTGISNLTYSEVTYLFFFFFSKPDSQENSQSLYDGLTILCRFHTGRASGWSKQEEKPIPTMTVDSKYYYPESYWVSGTQA